MPKHDIIQPSHCWSKMVPIPQTSQKVKHQAKSSQCLGLPKSFLKTGSQASLSILILYKTDPSKDIQQPQTCKVYEGSGVSFAEKQQRVDPYFQVLAFRFQLDYPVQISTYLHKHGRGYLYTIKFSIIKVSLLTLCGKEIKQAQYP